MDHNSSDRAMIVGTIIIFLILQAVFAEDCPGGVQQWQPCFCKFNKAIGLNIYCQNNEISKVYEMFDRVSPLRLRLHFVSIEDGRTTSLRENLFNGSTVETFMLQIPSLQSVHDDVLKGQDTSMLLFNFADSDLTDIPTIIIRKLKNLKAFDFTRDKRIKIVKSNGFKDFAGIYSLKRISYQKNKISYLEENAFAHLERIEVIDLNYNKLKFIDESSFPARRPRVLQLAYNHLRNLPLDFLNVLPQGTTINLAANKVQFLSREFIRALIKKGIRISLDKNEIRCGCSVISIVVANMNHMGNQFKGKCGSPPDLKGFPLAKLTYDNLPTCKVENEDLVVVMQAGFNTNIGSVLQRNKDVYKKIERNRQ